MCEICLKLAIKTPELRHWRHSGDYIVNFEQISHTALKFLLLNTNKYMPAGERRKNDVVWPRAGVFNRNWNNIQNKNRFF